MSDVNPPGDQEVVGFRQKVSYVNCRDAVDSVGRPGGPLPPDGLLGRLLGRLMFDALGREHSYGITADGISVGETAYPWGDFVGAYETNRSVVVVRRPDIVMPLTKRSMTEVDLGRVGRAF